MLATSRYSGHIRGTIEEMPTILIILTCLSLSLVEFGVFAKCPVIPAPEPISEADFDYTLSQQEETVQSIAGFALQNYQNIAALTASCDDAVNCSRLVCNPLRRDLIANELTCAAVANNVDCVGPHNTQCNSSLFSNNRAYVRYAPKIFEPPWPCDVIEMTCAQRLLDQQVFTRKAQRSNLTLLAWSYFGSNNGVQRIFPGKEVNLDTCYNYDLRKRPWYLAVTALQKNLVLLLDTGPRMHSNLFNNGGNAIYFDASRNVSIELLDTLNESDQVSVFVFGGNDAGPTLIGEPVTVINSTSVDDNTLDPLRANIRNDNNTGIQNPSGSALPNLQQGLMKALEQLNTSSSTLNVIIILTAGEFSGTDIPESLVDSLNASNVRVFTYRFRGSTSDSDGAIPPTLLNISCVINGKYEENLYDSQNPLGTIQSFYSYVAKLRFSQPGQDMHPIWVLPYPGASGLGNLTTAAYPVFDDTDDVLVGVAGVDLLLDNFQLSSADVSSLLQNRNPVNTLPLGTFPPTFPCQTLDQLVQTGPNPNCSLEITGICNDSDTSKSLMELLKERLCCEGCCNVTRHSLSAGQIAGISAGSVLGTIILGVLGCLIYWYCWVQLNNSNQVGDPDTQKRQNPQESMYDDPI